MEVKRDRMTDINMTRGKIFTKICVEVVEQGLLRTKCNQKFRELYKYLNIVADIRRKLLEWIGHPVRMDRAPSKNGSRKVS
jgi:hypothetical protein